MTKRAVHLGVGILVFTISSLAAACSFGSPDRGGPGADAPTVEDVAGRKVVPTIEVLTKTQAEDPTRFEMARLVVQNWNEAGIKATVVPVGSAELSSKTFTGKDYDAYAISYDGTPARLDPDNLLSRFFSANATVDGTNISQYTNAAYDAAYRAQQQASDAARREAAVKDAQELLYEQMPVIPLVYPNTGAAYRSDRWDGITITAASPAFSPANSTEATPRDGQDTMVVGTTTEPSTLNPVTASLAQDQTPLSHVYDTLLAIGADGALEDRAAQNLQVDGRTITLELRPGMRFSDGEPVTAQDAVFSLEYLKDSNAPLYAPILEDVASATSEGNSLTITLKQPQASFPAVALAQMPILPEHIWSKVKDPHSFVNTEPVGSGPFVLSERRPGASLTFSTNESFYDPAAIQTLRLVILGGFDAAVGGLISGEIDMIDSGNTVGTQYGALEGKEGIEVVTLPSHGWRGLHINMAKAPFDDRHFRLALAKLISTQDIIDIAYQGEATPGGSVIAPVLETWHNPELQPFTQDVEGAMQELSEAGYAFGPDDRLYYPDDGNDQRVYDNDVEATR